MIKLNSSLVYIFSIDRRTPTLSFLLSDLSVVLCAFFPGSVHFVNDCFSQIHVADFAGCSNEKHVLQR